METRNQVNYRERQFHDPGCPAFLSVAAAHVQSGRLDVLLENYVDDVAFIYCFQDDHACLALPVKRALLSVEDARKSSVSLSLDSGKLDLLNSIIGPPGQTKTWSSTLLAPFAVH